MYFFAATTDVEKLVAYMIGELDFIMYEGYSRFDSTIREITQHTNLSDFESPSGSVLLRGWRDVFNSPPEFTEINSSLTLPVQQRIELEGPAVFQIHSGHTMDNGALFPSLLNHWNKASIQKTGVYSDTLLDKINWTEVDQTSEALRQHIKQAAVMASVSGLPILPNALRLMQMGAVDFWDFEKIISKDCHLIDHHEAA